jgi:hypothetical protein
MIRLFYLLSTLLLLLIAFVGVHYTLSDRKDMTENIATIADLSRLSSLSLSVAWYEPRLHRIEKADNSAYPEMMPLDRMDFVYAE